MCARNMYGGVGRGREWVRDVEAEAATAARVGMLWSSQIKRVRRRGADATRNCGRGRTFAAWTSDGGGYDDVVEGGWLAGG